jgi:Fe-S-cluster containining protein
MTMPIVIHCQRCTACCRWPGEVCLDDGEIASLARCRGVSEPEFIAQHTRLRWDRRGLALKEQADGACIFLDDGNCAVQAAKPQQCRDFPNGWVNSLWGKVPLETMQRNYPMLFNCPAFQEFLKANQIPPPRI